MDKVIALKRADGGYSVSYPVNLGDQTIEAHAAYLMGLREDDGEPSYTAYRIAPKSGVPETREGRQAWGDRLFKGAK